MDETAIDARVIGSTVKIEVIKKVMKKYLHEGERSQSLAVARALEDATRDVRLSASDYREIAEEMEKNKVARATKRAKGK